MMKNDLSIDDLVDYLVKKIKKGSPAYKDLQLLIEELNQKSISISTTRILIEKIMRAGPKKTRNYLYNLLTTSDERLAGWNRNKSKRGKATTDRYIEGPTQVDMRNPYQISSWPYKKQ